MSWVNPARTGYPYDECTAIFARLYAWLGRWVGATRLGHVLEGRLAGDRLGPNLLGRDGIGYVFDTAIALDSLPDPSRSVQRCLDLLLAGQACVPVTRPGWWSQSVGAHQIKALAFLARHGRQTLCRGLVDGLVDACFEDGRFTTSADSDQTYLHSHCYALEGLVMLDAHPDVVDVGLDWLADRQLLSGALPAWFGGGDSRFPGDVVAQAARLWAAVDPVRWAVPLSRALQRLSDLQDASGLVRYDAATNDLNAWVSAFALQAARWAERRPDRDELAWML